jgi:tetratricopeptide (TPR) repeat protein
MGMKKLLLLFVLLQTFLVSAQEIVRESQKIIETRNVYLNGGMRSSFGGKSRVSIKIDLPKNTEKWYYSFSTSKGRSGTKNLGLALQLSALLLDPSGITSQTMSSITVPKGSNSIDVYLCSRENIRLFEQKADNNGGTYYFIEEGSVQNTKQAVVQIDDVTTDTWYLGLKNPSSLEGVNITIEVAAITKNIIEKRKSPEQEKAELYGSLGWTHFLKNEYSRCIEYSNKANEKFKLGWVNANKGLAQLMLGKDEEAMETYIEAITLIKKQEQPIYVFKEAIKDLDNILRFNPKLKGAQEIRQLLSLQF